MTTPTPDLDAFFGAKPQPPAPPAPEPDPGVIPGVERRVKRRRYARRWYQFIRDNKEAADAHHPE